MSDYYAKKKEESDKKIQEALEARNKRKGTAESDLATKKEASDSRIEAALASRSKRVQSSLPSVFSDIESRLKGAIDSYNSTKVSYGTYDDTYKNQRERRIEIANLRNQVDAYRKYMDDGVADNILSMLDQVLSGYDSHLARSKYESEDAYNKAVKQAEADAERWAELTLDYDPAKNLEEGKAGWSEYLAHQEKIAQDQKKAEEEKKWWQHLMEDLGDIGGDSTLPVHLSEPIKQGYHDQDARWYKPDERWTEEQNYTYGYLWKQSRKAASDYAYALNNRLNTQQEQEQLEQIMEMSTDNFWAGAAHTAGAIVAANSGLADYLGDLYAMNSIGYIPKSDGEVTPFEYSQAVSSGIGEHLNAEHGTLNEDIPIIGGKGWGDVYGLGTSIAQSALSGAAGGPGQALVTFFGSAAAAGVDDALKRGATDKEAIAYGTMLGLAEGLAEMIGVEKLMKIGSSTTIKQLVWNLLKQGASEGIEEGVTAVLNNFADNVVMADKSNFNTLVAKYMEQGLSEEEAKKKAWMSLAEGIAYDSLGGFVSGGVHAGPTTIMSYANTQSQYAKTGSAIKDADGGVDALMNLANEIAGVSSEDIQNDLTKQTGKVEKKATSTRVGRLYNTVQTANNQANASANQADIAKSLMRNGFTSETANNIAEALVANYNGQELTNSQKKLLKSVQNNKDVREAVSSIMYNSKSTMGQRNQNIRDFNNDVMLKRLAKASRANPGEAGEQISSSEGTFTSGVENGSESHYEVSVEGKTIDSKGNVINIVGVESVKDGKMVLKTEDGAIDSSEVQYASEADALIYEAVAKMGASPSSAWAMIKAFNEADGVTAQAYATAAPLAYLYGKLGYEKGVFVDGKPRLSLTATQSATLYQMGRSDAEASVKATNQASTESAISDKNADKEIIFEGFSYSKRKANNVQKASMEAVELINKMSNLEVHVYQSYKKDGKLYAMVSGKERLAPNGYFTDGNKIYIDINAGNMGEGLMLYTLSHEVGHYIAKWNAQDFKAISDFLFEHYGENVPVYDLLEAQKRKLKKSYKEDDKPIPSEAQLKKEAHEELVCDMLSRMLADKNAYDKLMELKQKDLKLHQKLGQAIKKAIDKLAKLIGVYDTQSPDFLYAASAENIGEEAFRQLQDLYIKAFVQADANFQTAEKNTTNDGGVKYEIREIGNTGRFYVQADRQVLTGDDPALWGKQIESYINEQIRKEQDIAIPTSDGHILLLTGRSAYKLSDQAVSAIGSKIRNMLSSENFALKGRAATHIDELIQVARYEDYKADEEGKHENDIGEDGFRYYYAFFRDFDGQYYRIPFSAGVNAQEETAYSIGKITKRRLPAGLGSSSNEALENGRKPSGDIIYTSEAKSQEVKTAVQLAYEKALKKKSGNEEATEPNQSTEQVGMEVDADTESVAPRVTNSERTWTESDYVQERDKAAKEIAKAVGVSVKKAKAYIDSVNGIAKMIAEDRVRLDYFSSPGRSSFVGNVEYGGSFDFSTLCKKRRLLTGTFSAIQKALPNTALTADEILDIRNRMKEKGLEVSCGLCYVEGSRASMGQFSKEFLKLYKQYYPDAWQPNMADVNTPDGIEWVRLNHPECYEQYEYFWNHYGTLKPGDKNLFASQQKPKLYQLHTEYKGEILEKFKDDDNVDAKNLNGGIRLQSFSDFEIVHLIDTMQIIMDMSRVGLAGQAYTKVPDFAWALGDTGLKINLSLIAKGVDENGRLIFDDVEGMPIETAAALRNRYSKNVGTILVAFNDEQLLAAMADERVDYIIPFHRSQWKKSQYAAMGLPAKTKDYTYMQNEKYIKPQYHEYRGRMVKDKATNYMPNEYWDFSKSGKENAEAYLEMCARNNKRPKFYKLLQNNGDGSYSLKADGSTDGYWKLLIDFKMYDNSGKGSPQMPVKPDFNMDEATRMLNEYSGGHNNFPVARGVVDEFVQEYKDSHKDVQYSDRDSDGNQLSKGQQEFFKDSKVRDANGNLKVMYHGTSKGGHTVFDTYGGNHGLFGIGSYFTDSKSIAESYTKKGRGNHPQVYESYLNIKNPIDMDAQANPAEWTDAFPYVQFPESGTNEDFYRAVEEYCEDEMMYKWEAADMIRDGIEVGMGYDGITHIGGGRVNPNGERHRVYIAFNAEQIKNTDNVKPTADLDIRYSDRDTESVSNRSLLANAFEGVAKNDIERNKIQEYKGKIDLIEAEERKLTELNEKIKELSFSKGPRDTKAIKGLQIQAKQTANRINIYDQQLLRLEASKPLQDVLQREKKKAYQRAEKKGKEALEAYREKAAKTQRELLERWQESRKKGIESREKTAMRHKIQSVVGELNQLLLNGDKKRHVPENLKKAVADALALVNMDTVGAEERAAKYAALIAKETDPDKIDAYTVTMENILRQGEKMGQRLKELRDAYEEIQESDDPDIANAYDPVIAGSLKELSQSIGNTSLRNMTIEQLSDVYDMYRMVLTRVRDANKSFLNDKKESISNLASRVVGEIRRTGGEHTHRVAALDLVRKFDWNNLKPVYAFEHLGSTTLTEAFNGVRKGEDVWAKDVTEARAYYLDKSKKYGYDSWDFKKKYRFESASEVKFELTLEQILSLYAYSKREQAHDHLRLGGFVFDSNIETYKEKDGKKSILKYKVNTADAHQITPEILADIIGNLSTEQKSFVDEMQDYLSSTMGTKGNEVTMKMYGVKLFKEKFYFPLKSAKQFMFEQNEVSGEVKIKNSGFTNKVVAKANNPVILNNFMDVWSGHVNDMSMYHAFVLPLEDFNRVFNYNSPKKEGQPPVSVKGTIQSAYSPAAVSYVKELITDLNGGAMSDPRETFAKSMIAKFKKAKVFSSLSVVIQQPSAIGRAFALVDPKYFHPTKDGMNHAELWGELKQYAPVAVIKEMGYFDTGMGRSTMDFIKAKEYSSLKEKAKALVTDGGYRDEVLSKAPALADELTWCAIWNAVKRETVAKHKDLRPGSEEFLKVAGERFTEVVTKTQVYDSVLARSANMRSKSGMMSMITSFMAEPTTTINMLEDAVLKAKRGDKRYAARAFASAAVSIILNNALVALVYGMRDDDEDETFAEKYTQAFVSGMLDDINPITYYPFLKDMWSVLQGYDVERSDMSLVSDLADAAKGMVRAYTSEGGDISEAWWTIAGAVSNICGIPMQNIRRDVNGAINFFRTLADDFSGRETTWGSMRDSLEGAVRDSLPVVGWLPGETKSDKLYDAIINGDTAYVDRLKSSYKDDSAYNNAVRKALRENDPRIKEAAVAKFDGNLDEYLRIAKRIIGERHFSQDNVVAAINAEINALDKGEKPTSASKASGMFKTEDFALAISQGDSAMANAIKTDIIQTAQKNGKTEEEAEKSFASSAKSELGKLYISGNLSAQKLADALQTYCDMDDDEVYWQIDKWDYAKETGSADGYGKYNDFHTAVQTGKSLKAVIKEYTDNGVETKTLASEITSHFKPMYREMSKDERASIKGYLLNAYELLGYDRSKKSKDIDKWLED